MFDEYGKITDLIIGNPQNAMLPLLKDSFILSHQLDHIFNLPFTDINIKISKVLNYDQNKYNISRYLSKFMIVPGYKYPSYIINQAKKESDNLERILSNQYQIKCYRPDTTKLNFCHFHNTKSHFNANNPRDVMFTYGSKIYLTPMAEKSRYYENLCYKDIISQYFDNYNIVTLPKSKMKKNLYDINHKYLTNNSDIVFDAADTLKIGKHLFIQRSIVTNNIAINFMKKNLKSKGYKVHKLEFHEDFPHHIDATLNTIKPGIFIENPTRPLLSKYKIKIKRCGWKFFKIPESNNSNGILCSKWLNMNWLQIDERHIVIEKTEKKSIKFLESLGMKCIPVSYKKNYIFGGGLHCTTLDLKRDNQLPLDYGFKHF